MEKYAQIHEGLTAIKKLYDDMLEYHKETREDFLVFTLGDQYKTKEANDFFKVYDSKRKALGIKMRLIAFEGEKELVEREYASDKNIQIKYLSHTLPAGFAIWGENVIFILWHETPTAYVIHSKEHAHSYREFFYDMWRMAK